jgi:hypothetical protein
MGAQAAASLEQFANLPKLFESSARWLFLKKKTTLRMSSLQRRSVSPIRRDMAV